MFSFKKLNANTVYTKVKTRKDAQKLADEAGEMVQQGKNVVIFFENRYLLHLASGQDPYQLRQAIEAKLDKFSEGFSRTTGVKAIGPTQTEDAPPVESKPHNEPGRDSSGKFVGKSKTEKTTDEPETTPSEETPEKRNFWDGLK